MDEKPVKVVADRLQELLKLRKRTGMSDTMFFSTVVELASECGVENLLAITPKELKIKLDLNQAYSRGGIAAAA